MAIVQSVSVFPATTTVVASTFAGLCSTAEVLNKKESREERVEENTLGRKRGHEVAEDEKVSKRPKSLYPSSEERPSQNNSAIMLPICNGRPANLSPVDWQNAVAAGSIPKETIIAHTDFTHTSAIAKRRLRKQKLQSQNSICSSEDDGSTTRSPSQLSTPSEVTNSPRMSFPAREIDATHSTNVMMGSIVSMATSMPNSSTEISKSILVQETHVTKQQQQHHHHQQQQHQQQQQPMLSNVVLPASGISTSIPVQELVHTHNHTHTHMHHFAGGWPGQLLPLTVYPGPTHSPNKDKTSVPSTSSGAMYNPMGQGYGYPVMYMVPDTFIPTGSTGASSKATTELRTSIGMGQQSTLNTAGVVVPPPCQMIPAHPWSGIIPSHNTGNAAAAMVTGGIPTIGTVPLLGMSQMIQPQFQMPFPLHTNALHQSQFPVGRDHKQFIM